MFYEGAPWPIQRRRALGLINLFTWPEFLWLQQVAYEDDNYDYETEGRTQRPLLDEAFLYSQWLGWRNDVVKTFSLETFVHPATPLTP